MVYASFLLKIPPNQRFHIFLVISHLFSHLFQFFFSSALLLSNTQLSKKKLGQYQKCFSNLPCDTICDDDKRHTTHDKRRRLGSQYPEWTMSLRLKNIIWLVNIDFFQIQGTAPILILVIALDNWVLVKVNIFLKTSEKNFLYFI